MKKAILLTGFFIFIFGFPSPASAARYQSSFSINCVTNTAGICTSGGPFNAASVTGQAFTITGGAISSNFSFRIDMCISTTSGIGGGYCTSFNTNAGNRTLTIPAGDTTAYRWGKALININNGPSIISGSFTVTGRVVEIFTVSDNPDPIQINQSSTITYSGADAWSCSIAGTHPNGAPFSSPVPCNSGSYLYINNGSSGTANYTVTFNGPSVSGNPINRTLSGTITVNSPGPTVDIRCNGTNGPCNIPYDGSVTLSWTSSGATSCTGDWPVPNTPKPLNGSEVLTNLIASRVYAFRCTNANGSTTDTVTVNVGAPPPPTVNLQCNGTNGPCTVPTGGTATLSWTTTNATSCTASGDWSGNKATPSGSESSPPITRIEKHRTIAFGEFWHAVTQKIKKWFTSNTALAAPGDNSVFISQDVPPIMTAGQVYSVSVTMRNTGPNTWTQATNYKLGSQNPQDNTIWGIGRVLLAPGDAIANGQQKIFIFNVTAPAVAGTYNFRWRMLQEGVNWFGAFSTNIAVNVLPAGSHNFTLTCTGPGGSAADSVLVQAGPNQPPVTSNVQLTEPDYCATGPVGTIQWSYNDPESTPQSAYQLQIDTDPLFGSPDRDSGKRLGSQTSWVIGIPLNYNTVYRTRIRTWDASDTPSAWTVMSLCTGPGCQPGNTSWQTPAHAYPGPVDFSWTPANPQVSMPTTFVHDPALTCVGGCSYSWAFGDGDTSIIEAPAHAYTASGSYQATFSVADSTGYTCPASGPLQKTVTVGNQSVPQFKEVLP